jgi:hypothetical protein
MNRQELNALHTRWRQDLKFEEPVLGKSIHIDLGLIFARKAG